MLQLLFHCNFNVGVCFKQTSFVWHGVWHVNKLIALHLFVHMKSAKVFVWKMKKESLRGKFKPCLVSDLHKPDRSLHEEGNACQIVGFRKIPQFHRPKVCGTLFNDPTRTLCEIYWPLLFSLSLTEQSLSHLQVFDCNRASFNRSRPRTSPCVFHLILCWHWPQISQILFQCQRWW